MSPLELRVGGVTLHPTNQQKKESIVRSRAPDCACKSPATRPTDKSVPPRSPCTGKVHRALIGPPLSLANTDRAACSVLAHRPFLLKFTHAHMGVRKAKKSKTNHGRDQHSACGHRHQTKSISSVAGRIRISSLHVRPIKAHADTLLTRLRGLGHLNSHRPGTCQAF